VIRYDVNDRSNACSLKLPTEDLEVVGCTKFRIQMTVIDDVIAVAATLASLQNRR
jgi:hypothetical protein